MDLVVSLTVMNWLIFMVLIAQPGQLLSQFVAFILIFPIHEESPKALTSYNLKTF
jgi:hypothetical protein